MTEPSPGDEPTENRVVVLAVEVARPWAGCAPAGRARGRTCSASQSAATRLPRRDARRPRRSADPGRAGPVAVRAYVGYSSHGQRLRVVAERPALVRARWRRGARGRGDDASAREDRRCQDRASSRSERCDFRRRRCCIPVTTTTSTTTTSPRGRRTRARGARGRRAGGVRRRRRRRAREARGESVTWADDDIATLARGGTRGVALMRLVIASADWREQPTATTLAKRRRATSAARLLTPHRTTRPTRWVKR